MIVRFFFCNIVWLVQEKKHPLIGCTSKLIERVWGGKVLSGENFR